MLKPALRFLAMPRRLITIVGATGAGKSQVGPHLEQLVLTDSACNIPSPRIQWRDHQW